MCLFSAAGRALRCANYGAWLVLQQETHLLRRLATELSLQFCFLAIRYGMTRVSPKPHPVGHLCCPFKHEDDRAALSKPRIRPAAVVLAVRDEVYEDGDQRRGLAALTEMGSSRRGKGKHIVAETPRSHDAPGATRAWGSCFCVTKLVNGQQHAKQNKCLTLAHVGAGISGDASQQKLRKLVLDGTKPFRQPEYACHSSA